MKMMHMTSRIFRLDGGGGVAFKSTDTVKR